MAADEVYDDKASVHLSEDNLTTALEAVSAIDVQLTSHEGFIR